MKNYKTKEEILRKRAQKLAHLNLSAEQDDPSVEVVAFSLGNERYAIEPTFIQEIFPVKEISFLPNTPPFVCGLINARRKVISLINLKEIFEIPSEVYPKNFKAMILQHQNMQFAIVVDTILGMQKILIKDMQSGIPTLTGIRQEFLKGITIEGIVLLDGEKLLSSPHIVVQENI